MPPVGFEPTISAGERPLGPEQKLFTYISYQPNDGHSPLVETRLNNIQPSYQYSELTTVTILIRSQISSFDVCTVV